MKVTFPKIRYFFYSGILFLNVCTQVVNSSNLQTFLFVDKKEWASLLFMLTLVVCIVLFIINNAKSVEKKKFYSLLVFTAVVIGVTLYSGNYSFAVMYLFIVSYPKGLDIRKLAKGESICFIGVILIVVCCAKLGLISSDIHERAGVLRDSCGFASPNGFANAVLLSMLVYIFYKKSRWNNRDTVAWAAISLLVFKISNGRMALIIEILLLLYVTYFIHRKKVHRGTVIYFMSKFGYTIFSVLSWGLTFCFVTGKFLGIINPLNALLSWRISFMARYYRDPGVSLFGQVISTVSRSQELATGERWSGLDNSYMLIMITWGIVGAMTFCILYYALGKYFEKRGDVYGALCLTILFFIGLTESYLNLASFNFASIMLGEMLSNLNSRARKDKMEKLS